MIGNVEVSLYICMHLCGICKCLPGDFMETVTPIRMFSILVLDICEYVYIEKIKGVKEGERNTNVC